MELNISDIIFASINFALMAAILAFFLHKPIVRILEERRAKIEAQNREAQILMEQANALIQQGKEEQLLAQQQALRSLQEASEQAERRKESLLAEAREKSDNMLKEARERLELEKEKATVELRNNAVTLAVQIAQKIIKTQVPVSSSNRIEEFVFQISHPESLQQLQRKIAQLGNDAIVELTTSQPITTKERELINNVLLQVGAEQTLLVENTNTELTGGCILTVGDLVFDGSVSHQLSRIVANLFADLNASSRMEGEEYEFSH